MGDILVFARGVPCGSRSSKSGLPRGLSRSGGRGLGRRTGSWMAPGLRSADGLRPLGSAANVTESAWCVTTLYPSGGGVLANEKTAAGSSAG